MFTGTSPRTLSGVVYDGLWVGENSKIPNINGIRKELVDEMRKIKPPVVRFLGDASRTAYDWKDGIGPTEKPPEAHQLLGRGESAQRSAQSQVRSQPVRNQ